MAEHEAPSRAFYDHETEEPRATGRRRRPVADWGVGEDVFDRLPSRRFARPDRRGEDTAEHRHAEHRADRNPVAHDDFGRHSEPALERFAPRDDFDRHGEPAPRGSAPRDDFDRHGEPAPRRLAPRDDFDRHGESAPADDFGRQSEAAPPDDLARHSEPAARRLAPPDDFGRRAEPELRRPRRPAADWLAEVSPRPVDAAGTEDSRSVVIGGAVEDAIALVGDEIDSEVGRIAATATATADAQRPADVRPRRTIVIGGHPDRLPAPRPRRPPKTALERVGASPDRLAAYAVGLGLLLILIAVLTTSH